MDKPENKARCAILLVSVLTGAGAIGLLYFFPPTAYAFYPRCLFLTLTGLTCSGCGSLRAMHALLHGHVSEALHFNAMLILSLPLFLWVKLRFRHGKLKELLKNRVLQVWVWAYVALWIVFGIARNLPGLTFAALKP